MNCARQAGFYVTDEGELKLFKCGENISLTSQRDVSVAYGLKLFGQALLERRGLSEPFANHQLEERLALLERRLENTLRKVGMLALVLDHVNGQLPDIDDDPEFDAAETATRREAARARDRLKASARRYELETQIAQLKVELEELPKE